MTAASREQKERKYDESKRSESVDGGLREEEEEDARKKREPESSAGPRVELTLCAVVSNKAKKKRKFFLFSRLKEVTSPEMKEKYKVTAMAYRYK